jgi:Gas vesicle synthesis protein GvpL/GvpF
VIETTDEGSLGKRRFEREQDSRGADGRAAAARSGAVPGADRGASAISVADTRNQVEHLLREHLAGPELEAALDLVAARPRPAAGAAAPRATRGARVRGLWLYGYVEEPGGRLPDGGVQDREVELVEHRGMAALVSQVRLADTRSARYAAAHDQVLDAVFATQTVVPSPPGRLLRNAGELIAEMEREETAIHEAFARLREMQEWEVCVLACGGEAGASASSAAADVHGRVSEHAESALLSGPDAPSEDGVLLDAAYLVPASGGLLLRVFVEELAALHAADGIEVRLTGPGPARHFV